MSDDHKAKGYHSKSEMKRVETLKAAKEEKSQVSCPRCEDWRRMNLSDMCPACDEEREEARQLATVEAVREVMKEEKSQVSENELATEAEKFADDNFTRSIAEVPWNALKIGFIAGAQWAQDNPSSTESQSPHPTSLEGLAVQANEEIYDAAVQEFSFNSENYDTSNDMRTFVSGATWAASYLREKPSPTPNTELGVQPDREMNHLIGQFVEYFAAIHRGEYEKNGRASRIRQFELILIDKGCELLGWDRTKVFQLTGEGEEKP